MSLRSLRTIKALFAYFLGFCIAHIVVSCAIYLLNSRMPLALKPVFSFAMQFVGIAFICSAVCLTAYAIKFAIDLYNSTKELDYLHNQLPKIFRAQDVPENILSSEVSYTNTNALNAQINSANNQLLKKVAKSINGQLLNNQSVEPINTRNNKIKNFILAEFNGKLTVLQVNSLMQQAHFRFLIESFIDIYTNRDIDLRKFMSDNDISINKLFDGISSEVIYKILSKDRPNLLNLINCFNRSSLNSRFAFRDAFAKLPFEQRIEILKDEVNGLACNDSDAQSPIMEFINKYRQQLDLNLPDNVIVMNASNVAMSSASAGNPSNIETEIVIDASSIANDLDLHIQRSSSLSSSNESQNSNDDQRKTNNTDIAQSLSRSSSSEDSSISVSDSSQESESKANEVKKSNSSEQPSSESESKANEVKESDSSKNSSKKSKIKSDETTKSSSSKDFAPNKHHNKKRKNRFSVKDAKETGNYYIISGRF